jgi:hypothetical protein
MVTGNLFKDVGGSGILVGKFSDESFETHRPYHPKDEREISSEEYISNNLITDVTNELGVWALAPDMFGNKNRAQRNL